MKKGFKSLVALSAICLTLGVAIKVDDNLKVKPARAEDTGVYLSASFNDWALDNSEYEFSFSSALGNQYIFTHDFGFGDSFKIVGEDKTAEAP